MFSLHGQSALVIERNPELLKECQERWAQTPPWGGSWKDFFGLFARSIAQGEKGITASELYGWTYGDVHATMPQIRIALREAYDDGLIKLLKDETPHGTHELYLLNPESTILAKLMSEPLSKEKLPVLDDGAVAISKFSGLPIHNLAVEFGFEEGSTLTAESLLRFFSQGPYTRTDLYNARELYPIGVSYFNPLVRNFVDALIKHGIDSGVLEESTEEGREYYRFPDALRSFVAQ